jgi:hypothetical protein
MRFFVATLLLSLATTLPARGEGDSPAPPTFAVQSKALEDEIARTGKIDVKLGSHLGARLDLAQLLATHTRDDSCATRLAEAESHYRFARDSLAAPLVLTAARGRLPMAGYYVEAARARCTSAAAPKKAALEAALAFARESVAGYRALFMYEPMTIMQFNVAQAALDLGDKSLAIKELQAAIELDRTFGFKADAEDNFRTLNRWQGKTVSDADVAAFSASFAPRSVTLRFGWKPTRVEATATFDSASYEGSSVKHTKFSLALTGSIKADNDVLVYETQVGEPKLDTASLGSDVEKKLVAFMARVLAQLPAAEISATGAFKAARDLDAFAQQMNSEIDSATAAVVPADDPRYPGIKAAMDQELKPFATADNLLGRIQEGYSLETGIWTDATLEQNRWVSLPLTLSMNGTPQGFIEHTVKAAFSRRLPCAAGQPADGCVELLIEAVPTPEAIVDVATKLRETGQGRLDYVAATRLRLVVDPATLAPYENETLRYAYLALANQGQRVLKISSEQSAVTYRYRK